MGATATQLSNQAPLPSPPWFDEQVDLLAAAVEQAALGNVLCSKKLLGDMRNSDLREWFVEHGQIAGRSRLRVLGRERPQLSDLGTGLRTPAAQLTSMVFRRDGYHCRYCGIRVVPLVLMEAFSAAVGRFAFAATGGSNADRHGAVLTFRANIDHVVPWKRGGQTILENLVTACWTYNFGKDRYTLEELGLEDPRARPPRDGLGWDGLERYRTPLLRVANARASESEPRTPVI